MAKSIVNLLKEAATCLERYDLGSALQSYREVLIREPANAAGAMGMAMVLNRSGKPGDALQLLTRIWASISQAAPTLPAAQLGAVLAQMGLAQQELGQLEAALESYRQATRLVASPDLERRIQQITPLVSSPAPVQQLILHARQLFANQKLEESAKTYIAAMQLQPDNADVLHELAMVLQDLGAHEKALPLMQKAVILAPDRPEFFNDLGTVFQHRADFVKAISFHKRAIKLMPNFVFAHINLGVAYKRLGLNDESLAAYRQALAINPDSAEAHNNLGNLLRVLGELSAARKHLVRALKIRPGYVDARANLDSVNMALMEGVDSVANVTATVPKKVVTKKKADSVAAAGQKKVPKKAAPKKLGATKTAVKSKTTVGAGR